MEPWKQFARTAPKGKPYPCRINRPAPDESTASQILLDAFVFQG
jgi:hypothetical protein